MLLQKCRANTRNSTWSKSIIELHGNIRRNKCASCGKIFDDEIPIEEKKARLCECGGYIRPDVVWFGEPLPGQEIKKAFTAAETCDLFLSIGTSAIVQPAASLPLEAKRAGAYVIEINPEKTVITAYLDELIQGASGKILPELLEIINN
jgi:NAD-dependent deacetylase